MGKGGARGSHARSGLEDTTMGELVFVGSALTRGQFCGHPCGRCSPPPSS